MALVLTLRPGTRVWLDDVAVTVYGPGVFAVNGTTVRTRLDQQQDGTRRERLKVIFDGPAHVRRDEVPA